MSRMIELHSVTKTYEAGREAPSVTALDDLSLKVEAGEFVVVTGRSGSGKTTLLNIAAGLARPTSGQVLLLGTDLWQQSDAERSRLRNEKVGFVFQFPSLLPSLTVVENVSLPASFSRRQNGGPRAKELLELVGLLDKVSSLPRQLSAGQQQRVVIARSLINRPEVLFADEPSSDLDEQTEAEIMELFAKIHRETGVTIVMVTHSTQLVAYGTRAIEMARGQVVN